MFSFTQVFSCFLKLRRAAKNTFSVRWVAGWVVGLIGIEANLNSTQVVVEVKVVVELGNVGKC